MRNMLSKHCAPHASGAMYELIIILSLFIAINFTVHMTSLHVRCFVFTLLTLTLFFTFKLYVSEQLDTISYLKFLVSVLTTLVVTKD